MEPQGHRAVRLRHLCDVRKYVVLSVRPMDARFCLHLFNTLFYCGSFFV
ncbi:MAG: hypothetical protein RMK65_08410 [Anaerolineae bacterium]|nr:hypothetical protein [Anaerolineae bacterium]